ncbi:S8 family serine peptidase [Bacillus carboniphilus]|uniref:S8 family serine peptidase n=1 Tax=Bacillus carboniphilus TaxID=86663 RepID=A0ABY9JUF3_9BACI|nr:S8 family serine peptidase [Bacillus carboniphilus]WLR43042.1 S8 family serine peptidase [Bacillus carboniphilus]
MKKYLLFITIIVTTITFPTNIFANQNDERVEKLVVKQKDNEIIKVPDSVKEISTTIKNVKVIEGTKEEIKGIKKELQKDSDVEYVEEVVKYKLFKTSDDSYYKGNQQDVFQEIGVEAAWDIYQPLQRVKVAIIDSGIDSDHSDLKANISSDKKSMMTSTVEDIDGHGTHVAGIIGAITDNNKGIASISKGTSLLPIKAGEGDEIDDYVIAQAIIYAVDNGAKIINLSLGGIYDSKVLQDAIDYADSKKCFSYCCCWE